MITLSEFAWKPFSQKQIEAIQKRKESLNVTPKQSVAGLRRKELPGANPKSEVSRWTLKKVIKGEDLGSEIDKASGYLPDSMKGAMKRQKEVLPNKKALKMSGKKKALLAGGALLGVGATAYGVKKLLDRRKQRSQRR